MALSQHVRTVLLHEIASRSGLDGLDLASAIAKDDPDPESSGVRRRRPRVRRADRHVAEVLLRNAGDKTFDLIARKGLVDEVDDEQSRKASQRRANGRQRRKRRLMIGCA